MLVTTRSTGTRSPEPLKVSRTMPMIWPMDGADETDLISAVLRAGTVRSVYQPIVDIASQRVLAFEALARGPEGPLASPAGLFDAARRSGCLAELDEACRRAAFTGAVQRELLAPLTLFVNVEPEVLDTAPLDDLLRIAQGAPGELRVVIEVTERSLAARPAELLRTMQRVREFGWGVALDDVGAEPASLAFMPLLRPDVVKLDLRLVQDRPGPDVAEIMNAVNAYAERSGALILAEGIETEEHRDFALALGATLGQGWLFGRPTDQPSAFPAGHLRLPSDHALASSARRDPSPFGCLPAATVLRESTKGLLIELSKQLEREAMRLGPTCVVASTFQEARHFTESTARRYRGLVDSAAFVAVIGEGLAAEPLPGLRGADLEPDDPLHEQWDITVLSPHFAAALLAKDLGDTGPDLQRRFSYALTYDRDSVIDATNGLLSRVVPRLMPAMSPTSDSVISNSVAETVARPSLGVASTPLLRRALAGTSTGVVIVDVDAPEQPIIYANHAFEALAGFPTGQILGRNCRFLQGPATDAAAIDRIRSAIRLGQESRERLLNYRGAEREPWWNDLYLIPAPDDTGRARHYIGLQADVTAQVLAEQALREEQERANDYLRVIEAHAYTDPLTGLPNRRRLQEAAEAEMWEIRAGRPGGALALLFLDLDGFKAVNDALSHAAGDELLVLTAQRLTARLRRSDYLGRLGGDEFLVLLPGLNADTAAEETQAIVAKLETAVGAPANLHGQPVVPAVSIGYSIFPADAENFTHLVHIADQRMYDRKHVSRI